MFRSRFQICHNDKCTIKHTATFFSHSKHRYKKYHAILHPQFFVDDNGTHTKEFYDRALKEYKELYPVITFMFFVSVV